MQWFKIQKDFGISIWYTHPSTSILWEMYRQRFDSISLGSSLTWRAFSNLMTAQYKNKRQSEMYELWLEARADFAGSLLSISPSSWHRIWIKARFPTITDPTCFWEMAPNINQKKSLWLQLQNCKRKCRPTSNYRVCPEAVWESQPPPPSGCSQRAWYHRSTKRSSIAETFPVDYRFSPT